MSIDTTTTAASIPDPDDHAENDAVTGGKVLDFRKPTDLNAPGTEGVPTVIDAELVNDDDTNADTIGAVRERVEVDPPGAVEDRSFEGRMRAALNGNRQPVFVGWLRSREEFTKTAKWAASHAGHTVAFHAVRLPVYGGKLALRSPVGAVRVLARVGVWVLDMEGAPLRRDAVVKGDADMYLKLARERADRVRGRKALLIAATAGLVFAGLALTWWGPWWAQWLTLASTVAALGVVGTPSDKKIAGRAVVTTKAQKLTSDVVVRALSALGISQVNQAVAKGGQGITFPAPIVRDGPGWRAEVDLPFGVTATDVMERRDKLASGLRRPLGCVWPEPVTEQHSGRLVLWVGDQDMAKSKPAPWPLAKSGAADLFKTIPFGTDQRGRAVGLDLMFSNVIIGAMPRMGKTFALRVMLLAAALDPHAELRLFELKGTGDLGMFEPVAHHYASGADDDTLEECMVSLRELYKDLERRSKAITRIAKENRAACPENKVTPELSRNQKLKLHTVVLAIDECQELFTSGHADEATKLCEGIIKRGPAMGVILKLATQRPDAKSLPPGVSANAGIRFCLRVMGQLENDMVLGTSSYKNGIRASTFGAKDKGIGYLVGAADDPQIVRTYYIDGPAAEKAIGRARDLREKAGTLSGHALGDDLLAEEAARASILADVLAVFGPGEDRLWSDTIVAKLSEYSPDTYRNFTPTALAAALKPYGITPKQVPMREDGQERNRRGYHRDTVADALTAAHPAARPTPDDSGE
jgi:S-DNA-T family DNA segregation ATPase FtsK/SpoIIIE